VCNDRVQRLMKRHGIKVRRRRVFVVTTEIQHDLPVAESLLARDFTPAAPDGVWSGDITYIATDEGWLYLATIMDRAGSRIVGWPMSDPIRANLVLIKDVRITQSIVRRANCWDNAPMKISFKMLKVESFCQPRYGARAEARPDIVDWIEGFHNPGRVHSSISYRTLVFAGSGPMAA
jgi:putative transposase